MLVTSAVAALERDHLTRCAGLQLEQLGPEGEDRRRARVVDLVGIGLRPGDEVLERRGRMLFVHDHDERILHHLRDRHEILERRIRHFRIDRRAHRHDARRPEQQCVAVGGRLGRDVRPQHAARARPVLDNDALAKSLLQPLRDQSRDDVGAAARREADDDLDRAVRVGAALRMRRRRGEERESKARYCNR